MMYRNALASAGLLALGALAACGDNNSSKLPAASGDIGGRPLYRGADLVNAVNTEHAPITAAWALQDWQRKDLPAVRQHGLATQPTPYVQSSRGYWFKVHPADLAAGVALPLTAPGSFIKISPQGAMDLELDKLVLVDGTSGRELANGAGVDVAIDPAALAKAGIPMLAGSLAFTTTLGAGAHILKVAPAAVAGMTADVIVQVEEPKTAVHARLGADNTSYLLGDTMAVSASWDGPDPVRTVSTTATAHLPDGTTQAIALADHGGAFAGQLTLDNEHVVPGALVDVIVDLQGVTASGVQVRRTVKTSAAYALPTAGLRGDATVTSAGDAIDVPVDVGSVGRYAVTGVVYGTDASGALVPFMMSQSAAFLDPGPHAIRLPLDAAIVAASGLSAPFELHDVQLQDQSRMGVLERRADGIELARR
jgi:hypothetical protein